MPAGPAKNGIAANIGYFPSDHSYGEIELSGECRNTADHHNDGKTNGTDNTLAVAAALISLKLPSDGMETRARSPC